MLLQPVMWLLCMHAACDVVIVYAAAACDVVIVYAAAACDVIIVYACSL